MYRIAVTNRHLCEGDFLERIRQIAQGDEYNAILLREKDLSHEEYEELAKKVLKITNLAGKKCILHTIKLRKFKRYNTEQINTRRSIFSNKN